jgi:ubiquinone biosynthesis protein COQ9
MIAPAERSAERDAAIDALLPNVPFDGWTYRALRAGLAASGGDPRDAETLFPGGAADMIAAWCDLADRRMERGAAALELGAMRTPARIRAVISLRLAQNRVHKEAIRRALAALALPGNARAAALCTARTVDAMWHAAGDHSADFSWYTKRAILTAVYTATLLYWLRDPADDDAATLGFLDRRLADVGRITRVRRTVGSTLGRLVPPVLRNAAP